MYAKVYKKRLNYIKNLKSIGVWEYVHQQNALSSSDAQVSELSKLVVLPSSFTGVPRYIHEQIHVVATTYVR